MRWLDFAVLHFENSNDIVTQRWRSVTSLLALGARFLLSTL